MSPQATSSSSTGIIDGSRAILFAGAESEEDDEEYEDDEEENDGRSETSSPCVHALAEAYRLLVVVACLVVTFSLAVLADWVAKTVFGGLALDWLGYWLLQFPLGMLFWHASCLASVCVFKQLLFPCGMRAACEVLECAELLAARHGIEADVLWCCDVDSFVYLRWWTLDHFFRNCRPFFFSSVLQYTRLGAFYYWCLGMRVDCRRTQVATDMDGIGEFDFVTLEGSGTTDQMRSYFVFENESGVQKLAFFENKLNTSIVRKELPDFAPLLTVPVAYLPSSLGLGYAIWIWEAARGFRIQQGSFLDYAGPMLIFWVFTGPAASYVFKFALDVFSPWERTASNMVVAANGSLTAMAWQMCAVYKFHLSLLGATLGQGGLYGCNFPVVNARSVSFGDNCAVSSATITGPTLFSDNCLVGIRARVRPNSFFGKGSIVGGGYVHTHPGSVVPAGLAVIRDWTKNVDDERNAQTVESDVGIRDDLGGGSWRVQTVLVLVRALHLLSVVAFLSTLLVSLWYAWGRSIAFYPFPSNLKVSLDGLDQAGRPAAGWKDGVAFVQFFCIAVLVGPVLVLMVYYHGCFRPMKALLGVRWRDRESAVDTHGKCAFALSTTTGLLYFCLLDTPLQFWLRKVWMPRFFGTATLPWVLKILFGMDVHTSALIFTDACYDFSLISLEKHTVLCHGTCVLGHLLNGHGLEFAQVDVRAKVCVMADRMVWPGADVLEGPLLGDGRPVDGPWPPPTRRNGGDKHPMKKRCSVLNINDAFGKSDALPHHWQNVLREGAAAPK